MVQKPEMTLEGSEARKGGYENICEIGKERIRRAGAKIQKENPEGSRGLDVGFRVYKVIPPEEAADDLTLVTVFTLAFGLTLDLTIDKCFENGLEWYAVGDRELFAVLSSSLTKEEVEKLAKRKPVRIGFFSPITGADELETVRIVHEISPETKVKFF